MYVENVKLGTNQILRRTISVDNNGLNYPRDHSMSSDRRNLLNGIYDDISEAGGITWLNHDSDEYFFDDMSISGNAHVAILSDAAVTTNVVLSSLAGDRTGVLHCGKNQSFKFVHVDVYLPINMMAYR